MFAVSLCTLAGHAEYAAICFRWSFATSSTLLTALALTSWFVLPLYSLGSYFCLFSYAVVRTCNIISQSKVSKNIKKTYMIILACEITNLTHAITNLTHAINPKLHC